MIHLKCCTTKEKIKDYLLKTDNFGGLFIDPQKDQLLSWLLEQLLDVSGDPQVPQATPSDTCCHQSLGCIHQT